MINGFQFKSDWNIKKRLPFQTAPYTTTTKTNNYGLCTINVVPRAWAVVVPGLPAA